MSIIIAPKSSMIEVGDGHNIWWKTESNLQTAFEIQYKLKGDETWSTSGKIYEEDARTYNLDNLAELVGVDFYEIYYRVVIYYDGINEIGEISSKEISEAYTLIFRHGILGTLKLYDGVGIREYPVYTDVNVDLEKNNVVNKINVGITELESGAVPIVDEDSEFASLFKIAVDPNNNEIRSIGERNVYVSPDIVEYGSFYAVQTAYDYIGTYSYTNDFNYGYNTSTISYNDQNWYYYIGNNATYIISGYSGYETYTYSAVNIYLTGYYIELFPMTYTVGDYTGTTLYSVITPVYNFYIYDQTGSYFYSVSYPVLTGYYYDYNTNRVANYSNYYLSYNGYVTVNYNEYIDDPIYGYKYATFRYIESDYYDTYTDYYTYEYSFYAGTYQLPDESYDVYYKTRYEYNSYLDTYNHIVDRVSYEPVEYSFGQPTPASYNKPVEVLHLGYFYYNYYGLPRRADTYTAKSFSVYNPYFIGNYLHAYVTGMYQYVYYYDYSYYEI